MDDKKHGSPESDVEVLRTKLEPKLIKKTSEQLGVALGDKWRVIEGPYPTANSASCVQFQTRVGTGWKTVSAFKPDGTQLGSDGYQYLNRPCYVHYHTATAQSIANATAFVIVNFDTKDYDTDNAVTTGAAWKFTVPPNKGGYYSIQSTVTLNLQSAIVDDFLVALLYNAGDIVHGTRYNYSVAGSFLIGGSVATTIAMNPGDYIQIGVYQSCGSAKPLEAFASSNRISISRLPG